MLRSMPSPVTDIREPPPTGTVWMLGVVIGAALQLQQPMLWPGWTYCLTVVIGVLVMLMAWRRPHCRRWWLSVMAGLLLTWGCTGGRAVVFEAQALQPAWESKDIRVVGTIDSLPQAVTRGQRLLLRVEQAHQPGQAAASVPLPPLLSLTWYGAPPQPALQAGQRWAWTVRLKAPHAQRNPHGMDWELWYWIQGVQATGYIRQGSGAEPPQWLAQTAHAPLAHWRGRLLQSMAAPEVASERHEAAWGVVQALVTGAQSRIAARDWQLFRDTGTAHLVSISGVHVTLVIL